MSSFFSSLSSTEGGPLFRTHILSAPVKPFLSALLKPPSSPVSPLCIGNPWRRTILTLTFRQALPTYPQYLSILITTGEGRGDETAHLWGVLCTVSERSIFMCTTLNKPLPAETPFLPLQLSFIALLKYLSPPVPPLPVASRRQIFIVAYPYCYCISEI